jgi:hypothetical protein
MMPDASSTTARRTDPRRRDVHTVLVCLPPELRPQHLAIAAEKQLALLDLRPHGTMPHFIPGTRRPGKLLDRWRDTAAGGPMGLLDLDTMRAEASASAYAQWRVWDTLVAGTRLAQPYWVFDERHHEDPQRYPLDRARSDYLRQPRIQAMRAYSTRPDRLCDLDGDHLEALQAGHATFTWLAAAVAVPASGIATSATGHDGEPGWLAPTGRALDDQISYVQAANDHLARLQPEANLVAMALPG